jgi:exodeoxyribonuclease-3
MKITDINKLTMRIISWNINGLRKHLNDDVRRIYQLYRPDILCLQEVKLSEPIDIKMYKYVFTNIDHNRKGYAGVLIASDIKPIVYSEDELGRYLSVEYEKFVLINVYSMNSSKNLVNLENRQMWEDTSLVPKIKHQMNKGKPVIVCGDLNVVHNLDLDIHPKPYNTRYAGLTDEERDKFNNLLGLGLVDIYRYLYPTGRNYSYLGYDRRYHWRIDYFLTTHISIARDVTYIEHEHGSDHIPVMLYTHTDIDQTESDQQVCSSDRPSQ